MFGRATIRLGIGPHSSCIYMALSVGCITHGCSTQIGDMEYGMAL